MQFSLCTFAGRASYEHDRSIAGSSLGAVDLWGTRVHFYPFPRAGLLSAGTEVFRVPRVTTNDSHILESRHCQHMPNPLVVWQALTLWGWPPVVVAMPMTYMDPPPNTDMPALWPRARSRRAEKMDYWCSSQHMSWERLLDRR